MELWVKSGYNPTYTLWIQSPCQMMIKVYNPLLSNVFRFHYHSQKVIGSLGIEASSLHVQLVTGPHLRSKCGLSLQAY